MTTAQRKCVLTGATFLAAGLMTACVSPRTEAGFVSLFDGRSLAGWQLIDKKGDGYGVKDGVIYCARGGGGHLFTEKGYADFILRLEFRLEPGSNYGIWLPAAV